MSFVGHLPVLRDRSAARGLRKLPETSVMRRCEWGLTSNQDAFGGLLEPIVIGIAHHVRSVWRHGGGSSDLGSGALLAACLACAGWISDHHGRRMWGTGQFSIATQGLHPLLAGDYALRLCHSAQPNTQWAYGSVFSCCLLRVHCRSGLLQPPDHASHRGSGCCRRMKHGYKGLKSVGGAVASSLSRDVVLLQALDPSYSGLPVGFDILAEALPSESGSLSGRMSSFT